MKRIKKLVCEVLGRYQKDYSQDGIEKNLSEWKENKDELINILRKHPQWNEDALAVKFEIKENRVIDSMIIWENRKKLHDMALNLSSDDNYHIFVQALAAACENSSKTITNKETAQKIKELSGVDCQEGQKTSRVINKICNKFGIDKHPEYNAVFAKIADALNPLEVKRTALLSVHPCDYLEMSNKSNSWHSCHCLEGGEYQAGTFSYMNDSVSMIFYTIDDDITENFFKAKKRTREVFCFGNGILLQSRLYPNSDNIDAMKNYKSIVQHTIASCFDVPNLWNLRKAEDEYYTTDDRALHYEDYIHSHYNANVSTLNSVFVDKTISIGNVAYCVNCSDALTENGDISCDNCDGKTCCNTCGSRVIREDAHYLDNEYYCSECVTWCDCCNEYYVGESHDVINNLGQTNTVCPYCFEEYHRRCDECEEYCDIDYIEEIKDQKLCRSCIESNFHVCEACEEYVSKDEAIKIDDSFYCKDCAEEIRGQAI